MRYSKKRVKKYRNKRAINSRKKIARSKSQIKRKNNKRSKRKSRQRGGGALKSMMSMVPFMSSEEQADGLLDSNPELTNSLSNQSVLVGALCNQYVKNNIKGLNQSEYDPVLDSLCQETPVSLPKSSMYLNSPATNSVSLKRSKKKKKINVDNVESSSQSGGVKLPSFLDGMKGLVNLYSAPMRAGFSAINSGINTIKSYKRKSSEKASQDKVSTEKASKDKVSAEKASQDDIERAEKEIAIETNIKKSEELMTNLSDNKKLDIKQVIKEKTL